MTDIAFVTSNQTKLAHARYLCRNYNVNILHYKKLYYGVAYVEPRIDDRDKLLADSFNDAVARWKKNVSDERLFFIEDTSVIIDALSDEKKEVPGVDVKYWMRDVSFKKLDRELRARGNNRRCSVTSHVVLFLTKDLKNVLGTKEDHMIFTSTVHGFVVEKEYSFETQILYPWLDNKTFNKWFVPDGYSTPISMLDISDADACDFRRGAIEQMLVFLKTNGALEEDKPDVASQLPIHFYDNFIICGKTCAGKSTIGRYLVDEYGYYHIEASEFMTQKLLETHGTKSGIDKHQFAAKVLEADPLFVVNKMVGFMKDREIYDRFVITGFRTKNEIDAFCKGALSGRLQVVFIYSSFAERYKRWRIRKREKDQYTKERFKEIDKIQKGMGIGQVAKSQDIQTFNNTIDGLSCFFNRFNKHFLNDSHPDSILIDTKGLESKSISLERAILISLALEYRKDETRSFTTTEISHLINRYFTTVERSKNNVSRYFNQTFYVYYEVIDNDRKNHYKISPIGYSEALKTLRELKSKDENGGGEQP